MWRRPSRRGRCSRTSGCHIRPALGELALTSITRGQIKDLLAKKRAGDLSKDSVRLIRSTISAIYADAQDAELVDANHDLAVLRALPATRRPAPRRPAPGNPRGGVGRPGKEKRLMNLIRMMFSDWKAFLGAYAAMILVTAPFWALVGVVLRLRWYLRAVVKVFQKVFLNFDADRPPPHPLEIVGSPGWARTSDFLINRRGSAMSRPSVFLRSSA